MKPNKKERQKIYLEAAQRVGNRSRFGCAAIENACNGKYMAIKENFPEFFLFKMPENRFAVWLTTPDGETGAATPLGIELRKIVLTLCSEMCKDKY